MDLLNSLIDIYKNAFSLNKELSLRFAFRRQKQIYSSATFSNSWIEDLCTRKKWGPVELEKKAYNLFDDLSTLIEGICKPILHVIHDELAIVNKWRYSGENNNLTLGAVVRKLDEVEEVKPLTRPGRWGLTLNEWRNIADHFSWESKETKVICKYGDDNNKQIVLDIQSLEELVTTVVANTTTLILSYRIFCVDHTLLAKSLDLTPNDLEPNLKVKINSIKTMLSAMGFEITWFEIKDDKLFVTLRNVLSIPDQERRLELFPAAILASYANNNGSTTIDFLGRFGKPDYRVSYDTEGIKRVILKPINQLSMADYILNSKYQDLS